MSINRNMLPYTLQKKLSGRTKSGAESESWSNVGTIRVSVKKVNEMRVTANVKYGEASHTGLTHYKDIRKNVNRLLDKNGVVYEILDVNPESRLTNLILKAVDTDV